MISRTIVLLPLLKIREPRVSSSVEFFQTIFNKTPHGKRASKSVPMLFETKLKQDKAIYISYNNVKESEQTNTYHLNSSQQIINTKNEYTTLSQNNNLSNTASNTNKTEEINNNFTKNKHIQNEYNTFSQNNHANSTITISSKHQNRETLNLISKHLSNTTSHTNKTQRRSIQENHKTFIYKTEKSVDTILKKIDDKIKHVSKSQENIVKQENSLKKQEYFTSNKEIQNISEKVYTLVVKKFEREQRRKGNLYA